MVQGTPGISPTDQPRRGALRVFKREASNSKARSLLRFKAARMPPLLSLGATRILEGHAPKKELFHYRVIILVVLFTVIVGAQYNIMGVIFQKKSTLNCVGCHPLFFALNN